MDMSDQEKANYYERLIPQQQEDSQVRWQLDFEDILKRMEREWAGYIWNDDLNVWEKKGRRIMTDDGIRQIVGLIHANVNKATALSNLSPFNISEGCKRVHLALASGFLHHQEDWQISVADMRMVRVKVMNLIFFGLKKGMNQGERNFIKQAGFIERHMGGGSNRGRSWVPGFGGD